jgi:hypothetical protein
MLGEFAQHLFLSFLSNCGFQQGIEQDQPCDDKRVTESSDDPIAQHTQELGFCVQHYQYCRNQEEQRGYQDQ